MSSGKRSNLRHFPRQACKKKKKKKKSEKNSCFFSKQYHPKQISYTFLKDFFMIYAVT